MKEKKKKRAVIVLYAVTMRLRDNYPFAIIRHFNRSLIRIDTSRTLIMHESRSKTVSASNGKGRRAFDAEFSSRETVERENVTR